MTDELRLPCRESDSPDDWFIAKDGKQYASDEPLEHDERTEALARRRHAKEDCHTSCAFRTRCLDMAIQKREQHGTWGGYYEEELQQIYTELDRRKQSRTLRIDD